MAAAGRPTGQPRLARLVPRSSGSGTPCLPCPRASPAFSTGSCRTSCRHSTRQAFAATRGPLRPDRVAAAAAGQHECDELRRTDFTRARRLLQPLRGAGGHASSSPTARAARTRRPPWSARSGARAVADCWVVRSGNPAERVFGADGSPEAAYAPDPAAADKTRSLAEAAGGEAFSEDESRRGGGGSGSVQPTSVPSARNAQARARCPRTVRSCACSGSRSRPPRPAAQASPVAPDPHGSVSFCGAVSAGTPSSLR